MARETKLEQGNGRPGTSPRAIPSGAKSIVHDAVELAELQAELAMADVRECARKMLVPAILLGAGLILFLGTAPIFLMALAAGLHALGLSVWLSYLLAGIAGLVTAALLGLAARMWIRPSLRALDRSKDEFARNVQWLKVSLKEMKHHYAE